ncbi:hypothetical protein Taro_009734 [Colocasia esculenta]|uniref:Late embryogenesis abundant protein LEA-2 subgroup domain-containing protein n=1 Tax=Colocasia esculenta TaxID=4460 RepID=A0A843U7C4_COLES|nr:hypothetical protein [Colocasia esculenta]
MGDPGSSGGGKTNLASCLVATTFLILVLFALAAVVFVLFRPREPRIEVNAFQVPSFAAANGTVRFTFAQYATVRNPNRAAFSHYDSTLQLVYAGSQVAFMFIPAGEINGGRTQYMSATFDVGSFPLAAAAPPPPPTPPGAGSLVVESRMKLKGKVRVLRFLTHRVEAAARCRVGVSVRDGSVLGFRC